MIRQSPQKLADLNPHNLIPVRDKSTRRPIVITIEILKGRVILPECFGRFTRGSHITYYSLMFFIAYDFKGQVHVFAGLVKVVSHSSCRTSAILKYFVPCTALPGL